MPSPHSRSARAARVLACVLLAVLTAASLPAVPAAQGTATSAAAEPTEAEVSRALDEVKKDPNLSTERSVRTLRWRGGEQAPPRSSGGLPWLGELLRWFGQGTRLLMWIGVAVLAVMLATYIIRTLELHRSDDVPVRFVAPTHVRDLDIRPESLPADVGGAARALWNDGQRRAALALLYRGLLSRLAHVHQIPIRDSSTEGDCLQLTAHLGSTARDYTSRLVPVWQRAVYGNQFADTGTVASLCDEFDAALGSPGGAV